MQSKHMQSKVKKKVLVPVTRREKLLAKLVENGSKAVVSKAMIEVGYSPNTAKAPSKVTKSKAWEALLEQYVPDSLLTDKLNQLLNKKTIIVSSKGKIEEQPHSDVKGALDMAFKIKGKYASDKNEKESNKLTREYLDRLMVDD